MFVGLDARQVVDGAELNAGYRHIEKAEGLAKQRRVGVVALEVGGPAITEFIDDVGREDRGPAELQVAHLAVVVAVAIDGRARGGDQVGLLEAVERGELHEVESSGERISIREMIIEAAEREFFGEIAG